jgi:hypothetical protein
MQRAIRSTVTKRAYSLTGKELAKHMMILKMMSNKKEREIKIFAKVASI